MHDSPRQVTVKSEPMDALWSWQLLDADGVEVGAADTASATGAARPSSPEFPTQSDAASWIGQEGPGLLEAGIAAVTLLEGDTVIYGPMPLTPLS